MGELPHFFGCEVWRCDGTPVPMKRTAIAVVVLLLVVPAAITAVSRPAGLVASVCAVAVLVYLVLRNERGAPHP